METLVSKIFKKFEEVSKDYVITDIVVGLRYTYVELNNEIAGISNTYFVSNGFSRLRRIGFKSQASFNVLFLLKSENILERAIAWAVVNALSRIDEHNFRFSYGNIVDEFPFSREDRVLMFGYFKPIEERLKKKVNELFISELYQLDHESFVPQEKVPEVLKRCNKVIVSATSLINNTFCDIAGMCKNGQKFYILGPSTPFLPDIFKDYGVAGLSGVKILNRKGLRDVISEGGGTLDFGKSVLKVNLKIS